MGLRHDDGVVRPSDRGQSALLGLVLLIGMVAAVSVGILLVAGDAMTTIEHQSENERIEQSFVELSQTMTTISTDNDSVRAMDFDAGERGAVVMTNTGNMTIKVGDKEPESVTIGAIEYQADDGTKIAYQAGGVFRETGNETQVVSAPPIDYNPETGSETLSFPVVEVSEETRVSSGDISIEKVDTVPLENTSVIERKFVTIEIESQYYRGWEQHFEQQVGEDAVQVDPDPDNNTGIVSVKLGQSDLSHLYEHAAVTVDLLDAGNSGPSGISGPVMYGGNVENKDSINGEENYVEDLSIAPIDEEIEDKIDETEGNTSPDIDGRRVTSGVYHEDENLNINNNVEFDVSGGDIKVIIDGDLNVNNDITVTGIDSGNELHFYTNGELSTSGDTNMCVKACYNGNGNGNGDEEIHSQHLQIYGTSDFDMSLSGNNHGEGIIFAPGSEITQQSGNQNWYGAIIVDSLSINGNLQVQYDEAIEGGPELHAGGDVPDITYLNVAKHVVTIEN